MTAPLVAVLDYGIGNLSSAQKALVRMGADARLTRDAGLVVDADGVVLPGVGAFGACMDALRSAGLSLNASDAASQPSSQLSAAEYDPESEKNTDQLVSYFLGFIRKAKSKGHSPRLVCLA